MHREDLHAGSAVGSGYRTRVQVSTMVLGETITLLAVVKHRSLVARRAAPFLSCAAEVTPLHTITQGVADPVEAELGPLWRATIASAATSPSAAETVR